jgi:ribonuclease E
MRAMRGAWDGWRRACEHAAFLTGVALARLEAAAEHGARPAPRGLPANERGVQLRPEPRREGVPLGAALPARDQPRARRAGEGGRAGPAPRSSPPRSAPPSAPKDSAPRPPWVPPSRHVSLSPPPRRAAALHGPAAGQPRSPYRAGAAARRAVSASPPRARAAAAAAAVRTRTPPRNARSPAAGGGALAAARRAGVALMEAVASPAARLSSGPAPRAASVRGGPAAGPAPATPVYSTARAAPTPRQASTPGAARILAARRAGSLRDASASASSSARARAAGAGSARGAARGRSPRRSPRSSAGSVGSAGRRSSAGSVGSAGSGGAADRSPWGRAARGGCPLSPLRDSKDDVST